MANHQPEEGEVQLNEVVEDLGEGLAPLADYAATVWDTLGPQLGSFDGLIQLGVVIAAGVPAFALRGLLRRLILRVFPQAEDAALGRLQRALLNMSTPFVWLSGLWIGSAALTSIVRPGNSA